jgi:hypothetical protein
MLVFISLSCINSGFEDILPFTVIQRDGQWVYLGPVRKAWFLSGSAEVENRSMVLGHIRHGSPHVLLSGYPLHPSRSY